MLKSNAEAFKKEASAASEKSRSLQVAYSKTQATLDSTSQVTVTKKFRSWVSRIIFYSVWTVIDMNVVDLHIHCIVVTYLMDLSSRSLIFSSLLNSVVYKEVNFCARNINTMQINCPYYCALPLHITALMTWGSYICMYNCTRGNFREAQKL